MDTIEQLTKLQPEEVYGDVDASDARVEHERDLAFASWQLRANALLDGAWVAYRQQLEIERVVSGIYEKHREALGLKVGLAIFADVSEVSARTSALFGVWGVLGKLARAEGRDDITPQQESDAMAAVVQLEEDRVEKLLRRQASWREQKAEVMA